MRSFKKWVDDNVIGNIVYYIDKGDNVDKIVKNINSHTGTIMKKMLKKSFSRMKPEEVSKTTYDKLKRIVSLVEEASTTVAGVSGGPGGSFEPHGMAFGKPYFDVCQDTFSACYKGGKEHRKHWLKKLGNTESSHLIRRWTAKNPGKQFLLKLKDQNQWVNGRA